jgi:hypothetical protein
MGRRKKVKSLNKALSKPFCWYCQRTFDDEAILVSHQKAKHFKCLHCTKRFNTVPAMVLHAQDVHKHTITKFFIFFSFHNLIRVPDSVSGFDSVIPEIYGMAGIPPGEIERFKGKLLFYI